MKWVTWENVGIDRMACAWLIKKRIDSEAVFIFVPAGHMPLPEEAEPFDIPGVRLSHRVGHCTFHTMLREYKINDPIMDRIARIVDEADTVQELFLEPIAPGLDYLCEGIRLNAPDDLTAIERGSLVFEALHSRISSEK